MMQVILHNICQTPQPKLFLRDPLQAVIALLVPNDEHGPPSEVQGPTVASVVSAS